MMPKYHIRNLIFTASWSEYASIMELIEQIDPKAQMEANHTNDLEKKNKPIIRRDKDISGKVLEFLKSKPKGASGKEIRKALRTDSYSGSIHRLCQKGLVRKEGPPRQFKYFLVERKVA